MLLQYEFDNRVGVSEYAQQSGAEQHSCAPWGARWGSESANVN